MAAWPWMPSGAKKVTGAGNGCDAPRPVAVLGLRAGQNPFVDAQGQWHSGSVVRLRAVLVNEHLARAPVAEEGATERPDLRRCGHPTGRLGIQFGQRLQFPVLFLREKGDAHLGSHLYGAA